MSTQPEVWNEDDQAAFSRVQELFVDENYRDSLVAASNLVARAEEAVQSGVRSVLLEIIRECVNDLLPAKDERKADLSCSFCGRSPPEVRLGAGGAAFICNECVELFSKVLSSPASSGVR